MLDAETGRNGEPTLSFRVSEAEAQLILDALQDRPMRQVYPLVMKLFAQSQAQLTAAPAAPGELGGTERGA